MTFAKKKRKVSWNEFVDTKGIGDDTITHSQLVPSVSFSALFIFGLILCSQAAGLQIRQMTKQKETVLLKPEAERMRGAESDRLLAVNDSLRAAKGKSSDCRWLALESNPDIFNSFYAKIGAPKNWAWVDVLGLEDELLSMITDPVLAVILLFPCTRSMYAFRREEERRMKKEGSKADCTSVYFVEQVEEFGNACGTIAAIHALANSRHHVSDGFAKDGAVSQFLCSSADMDPCERGHRLVTTDSLKSESDASAANPAAQTECPSRSAYLDHHFVAFTRMTHGGVDRVIELDGTKFAPIDHGRTNQLAFLKHVAQVVKENFVKYGEGSLNFSAMALTIESKIDTPG